MPTFIICFRLLEIAASPWLVVFALIHFTIRFPRSGKKKREKGSCTESMFYFKSGTGLVNSATIDISGQIIV